MRNQEVRFQLSPGKPEIPHARIACAEWGADELIAIEVDECFLFGVREPLPLRRRRRPRPLLPALAADPGQDAPWRGAVYAA